VKALKLHTACLKCMQHILAAVEGFGK